MNQIYKPLNKNVYVNYHKESEIYHKKYFLKSSFKGRFLKADYKFF